MTDLVFNNSNFAEISESDLTIVEGGDLFNDICKGVTSVLGGAVIKGAVSGAISGSAAGPVGTVAGIVGGVVIAYAWDKVF